MHKRATRKKEDRDNQARRGEQNKITHETLGLVAENIARLVCRSGDCEAAPRIAL
jgi:hypothetical protein